MRDEKADADVPIPGPQTPAILEWLIVILFSTPMVICFWSVVLGLAVHGGRVQ